VVRQHIRPGPRHDSRAMPELLKGRALKWFISNIKQWKMFLPRDFLTKLKDQVKQRNPGFGESFKDYMTCRR